MNILIFIFLMLSSALVWSKERWISTVPSQEVSLDYLGLSTHLVGVSSYCPVEFSFCTLPKVGTSLDFSLERLKVLRPDVIWLSPHTPHKWIKIFEAQKLRYIFTPHDRLEHIEHTLELMSERGDEIVQKKYHKWKNELQLYKGQLAPRKAPTVIVLFPAQSLQNEVVVGVRATFYHDMISFLYGESPSLKDSSYETWGVEQFYKSSAQTTFVVLGNHLAAPIEKALRGKKIIKLTGHHLEIPGPHLIKLFPKIVSEFKQ